MRRTRNTIYRAAAAFLLLSATILVARAQPASTSDYDVLIRGGRIVDGTGNPWFIGDLAVTGDRIVRV